MDQIQKRMEESFAEVSDITGIEKAQKRIEFMTGIMGGHQHRISLVLRKGKIMGKTERVDGHVHSVDLSHSDDGDILGFTGITDNHKHRAQFTVKEIKQAAKAKAKEDGK